MSKQNHIWLFFALSLVISIPVFLGATPEAPVTTQLVLFFAGSYIPAILAWIFLRVERDPQETSDFWTRVRTWRVDGKWWAFALLLPTGIWFASGIVFFLQGDPWPASYAALVFFPIAFLTNLGEEIGWRGFALPRLMSRFDALSSSLILGAFWGAFHIALNLHRPLFAALTFAFTLMMSVILTWLFLRTKSVILTTTLHATFNTWTQVFLVGQVETQFIVPLVITWLVAMYLIFRYKPDLLTRS